MILTVFDQIPTIYCSLFCNSEMKSIVCIYLFVSVLTILVVERFTVKNTQQFVGLSPLDELTHLHNVKFNFVTFLIFLFINVIKQKQ